MCYSDCAKPYYCKFANHINYPMYWVSIRCDWNKLNRQFQHYVLQAPNKWQYIVTTPIMITGNTLKKEMIAEVSFTNGG